MYLAKLRIGEKLSDLTIGTCNTSDAAFIARVIGRLNVGLVRGWIIALACEIVARWRGKNVLRIAGSVECLCRRDESSSLSGPDRMLLAKSFFLRMLFTYVVVVVVVTKLSTVPVMVVETITSVNDS